MTRGDAEATNGVSVETKARTGASDLTTVPATEHTGQTWDATEFEVRSAHWWNCAARNNTARSSATNASFCVRLDIPGDWFLRRRLDKKGYPVKGFAPGAFQASKGASGPAKSVFC